MLHDDFLHHRQSQSRPVALGGKKRPKQLWHRRWRNARTIVSDHDALAARFLAFHHFSPQRYVPAAFRFCARFCAIPGEIQQRLPQQSFVSGHRSKISFVLDHHLRHHLRHFGYRALQYLFELHALFGNFEGPRVFQELRHHVRYVPGLVHDFPRVI